MPDHVVTTPSLPADQPAPAARPSVAARDAQWDAIASPDGDRGAFCQAWLGLLCTQVPGTTNGLLVLRREDGGNMVAGTWPMDRVAPNELGRMAERAIAAKRSVVAWGRRRATPDRPLAVDLFVAQPIGPADQPVGAVSVCVGVAGGIDAADPDAIARQLRWGGGWIDSLLWRVRNQSSSETISRASVGLDLLAVVSEHRRLKRAAMAVVNELAIRLRCDRVSLGLLHRGGAKLASMSHAATFQNRSQVVDAIESAMEECLFQGAPVTFPALPATQRMIAVAHRDLATAAGPGTAVATVVLPGPGGRPIGAITLERQGGQEFDADTLKLAETTASLIGPVIHLQHEANGWIGGRAVDSVRDGVRMLLGRGRPSLKLAAIAAVAVVLYLTFATGEYRVTAKSVLEGQVQRAAAAPFDGFITTAPVRPGDRVRAGALLATLDDKDLTLERARARAEREKLADKYRDALAKHDRPTMVMAASQLQQAESQLALADYKLSRTRITAPIDGLIVAGDLSQMLGSPVEKGKVLYELAPLEDYRLVVQVDERDLRHVELGQQGSLALAGMPSQRMGFTVTRVTPISTAEEGRNFFRVEGRLTDTADPRLRPGMEGVAKIDAGSHSLVWIWSHSVIDWLRLAAWKWLP
ncbi:MAG: HlyD family efflux transporter periplasmic adaptor subunit [Acetobacteraceae bacterium]